MTSASPRHILVHAGHPDLDLWLLAAHSPHSGSDRHQRDTWWTELATLIEKQVSTGKLIVLIDANATTGPQDSCHVFDFDDVTSGNTHFLREFMESCDLCAPSTSTIHQGDHSTWQNPADSSEHRIDFVLVPIDWKGSCKWSSTLDSLDFGHLGDHRAVGLQLTWTSWIMPKMPQPHQLSVKGHSRAHIDAVKSQESLQHYHPCPWHTDIEGHVDHFNHHLLRVLHEHCPPTSSGPKKSFITNEIWTLRKKKLGIQRALRLNRRTARREALHQLFGAWKNSHTSGPWFSSFRITLDVRRVRLYLELRHRAKQLRKALASAKRQEIQRQVDSLPTDCAASQILHKLKAVVGTTNPKQRKASPLPAILDEKDNPCTTPAALVDRWVDFFSAMEGGERLSEEALRRKWIEGLSEFLQSEMQLPADALPSLTDLELAFRRVKPHKAVGEDGIPPEVCHLYPTRLARFAYGQLLKLCTHGQEALQHKGGVLIAAWKRKGSQLRCESYRSLLISSHVAKAVHRAVRDHQSSIYETFLQGQQIGGRKYIPVSMGVHFIRAAARMAKRQQMSHALIFLDLREAFYRVLRPLAVGGTIPDELLAVVASRLHLPPDALSDLHALLRSPSGIESAGMPKHLRRTLLALHTNTHFRVPGQTDRVHTRIGSRPGDPFADVVFGYMFARILATVERRLAELGILETVVDSPTPGLQLSNIAADPVGQSFLGPTWMDDLCITVTGDSAHSLERKAGVAVSILLETCMAHGVTPNLDRGKSEVLFSFRGKGSRGLRHKYFSAMQAGKMPVITEYGVHGISVVGNTQPPGQPGTPLRHFSSRNTHQTCHWPCSLHDASKAPLPEPNLFFAATC